MGLRHDGNDPVALTQTRCPRARVQGTDHDGVALVMSRGAGIEALLNVVRVCTPDAAGPVSAIATSGGSSGKRWLPAQGGCPDEVRLLTTLRPIRTLPRSAEELALGS